MTDERLDQILKQALAPEIADTEIAVKQAGRNYYMKKIWKIGVAAVACAALLVAGTIAAGHQTVQKEPGAVSISKNPFVICAQAAELTKDKPVYIRESVSNTFGYAAWDDGKTGKMGFVMEMPLSVKGDDIKTISYHMENGFFQVTDTGETDDMIVDSEAYEGDTAEAGITERGETEATLDIYQKHADDYMVKPVELAELEMRVRALLRRSNIEMERKLIVGNLEMDADGMTAMINGEEIPVTTREFNILYKLLSYPKKTFTRAQLMDEFWGLDSGTSLRAVDVYVTKLRDKFSTCDGFEIKTVRGLGYKAVLL